MRWKYWTGNEGCRSRRHLRFAGERPAVLGSRMLKPVRFGSQVCGPSEVLVSAADQAPQLAGNSQLRWNLYPVALARRCLAHFGRYFDCHRRFANCNLRLASCWDDSKWRQTRTSKALLLALPRPTTLLNSITLRHLRTTNLR